MFLQENEYILNHLLLISYCIYVAYTILLL